MIPVKLIDGRSARSQAPAATPTVFVVDADVLVRESLELLVAAAGWRSETFASASDFVVRSRASVPSCLVLDVTLPDLGGLDLQQRLAADRPEIPVIFITAHGDVPTTVRAMKAGAIEFLIKPFADQVLIDAIHCALEHSRRVLEGDAKMSVLRESYASLTPREREVMVLVASGLLNKQVGGELGISEITVKAHRGQVMRKMRAGSLPALVNMVSSLGLEAASMSWSSDHEQSAPPRSSPASAFYANRAGFGRLLRGFPLLARDDVGRIPH